MRCSSSCEPDSDFFGLLGRTLDAIAVDVPAASRAMGQALGERTVEVEVDGRVMFLSRASGRLCLSDRRAPRQALLRLERPAVVRLLQGECTLLEAVLRGEVIMQGAADDLAALGDVLTAFVQGAVRSASTPGWLAAYLEPTARGPAATEAPIATIRGETHHE